MKPPSYKVRPAYGSKELLIEFSYAADHKKFIGQLMTALQGIRVKVAKKVDLWMNDEVLMLCESDVGSFEISKDTWDLVFIMAPDNQPAIGEIDTLLSESGLFERQPVDFESYA